MYDHDHDQDHETRVAVNITQALGGTTNFGHHIICYAYPPIWVKGQGLGGYTWLENSLI